MTTRTTAKALKPEAICMRIARALYALGPGRHFDDDLVEAHKGAANAYVKPQSLPFVLLVLERRSLVVIRKRKTYTTVELTSKGSALFESEQKAAASVKSNKTPPRAMSHDFSAPLQTPIVTGPYIRPDGLQHTRIPSRSGSSETPYIAHA